LFLQKFQFSLPARVNFVGGGGKTSLILKLLEEYSETVPTLFTTTTRIHPPHPAEGLVVLSGNNEVLLQLILERAGLCWSCNRRYVATHLSENPDLLPGVTPEFASRLDPGIFPVILNEADGARSMSLKMPRANEPVLMTHSRYLIPVIGLDCLNRPLGPETLFRWELAAERYHWKAGTVLDPAFAASILLHREGVCRGWKPGTQIIPFINKVDSEADDESARALALALLNNGTFPIERVVMGSVQCGRIATARL
jgi:probable selenium-dependent hydroxylase accessory protein YqeC